MAAKPGIAGSKAKQATFATLARTTIARSAPVRSASVPQAPGATTRASCGSASTQAISPAFKPRAARYGGK
jgi:hypothetical protein